MIPKTEPELLAEIERLEAEIAPLREQLSATRQALLKVRSKFKVGDVIQWEAGGWRRRMTKVGVVLNIQDVCGDPCWMVRVIRKDGKEGRATVVRGYSNPTKMQESANQ